MAGAEGRLCGSLGILFSIALERFQRPKNWHELGIEERDSHKTRDVRAVTGYCRERIVYLTSLKRKVEVKKRLSFFGLSLIFRQEPSRRKLGLLREFLE